MPRSRAPLFIGIAIVAMLVGALSAQFMRGTQPMLQLGNGTLLPTARAVPEFQLLDGHGQAFTHAQLTGHWSVLFFGYTSCPDICPTTLSTLAQVHQALANLATPPQFVFISVDPKRDTPAQMNNYVNFFDPAFTGLTGEQTQIDLLTKALGVPVIIQDQGNDSYTVDHAATLFLLDPQARMTAIFSPPHTVATLAEDLRKIIQQPIS
jgi:protein SCO1/2